MKSLHFFREKANVQQNISKTYIKLGFSTFFHPAIKRMTLFILLISQLSILSLAQTITTTEGCKYYSNHTESVVTEWTGDCIGGFVSGNGTLKIFINTDLVYTYEGSMLNGKENGIGKMAKHDGEKYEGAFVNGKYEGQGTYFYANGEKYVGGFKNNRFNGKGALYYADGTLKQPMRTIYYPPGISKKEKKKYFKALDAIYEKGYSVVERREAVAYLKELVAMYPEWGDAYYHIGSWNDRGIYWEKAVLNGTRFPKAYKMMADYYFRTDQYTEYLKLQDKYDSKEEYGLRMRAYYELYKKSKSLSDRKFFIANAKKQLEEIEDQRISDRGMIELKYRLLYEKENEFLELTPEQYEKVLGYNNNSENETIKRDAKRNYENKKRAGTDEYTITLNGSWFVMPRFEYYFGFEQRKVDATSTSGFRLPLYCEGTCNPKFLKGFNTIRRPRFAIITGNFVDGVLEGPGIVKTDNYLIQSDFKNGIPNGNTFILEETGGAAHYVYDLRFKEMWDVQILEQLIPELINFITDNFDNKAVLGKRLGVGSSKGSYNFFIGNIVNGKAEGKCIHTSHNSTHYEIYAGEFKNGKREGEGSLHQFKIVRVREDRETKNISYSGIWKDGELVSRSEMTIDNQQVKICDGDCENGTGKKTYQNGDVYEGQFKNGKRHGQGTYTSNRYNRKHIGEWKNDLEDGYGEFIGVWGLGESKKGYWVKGKYYGKYRPKDYSTYSFKLNEIIDNTYWYDIYEGNSKVFRLQVSTHITDYGNVEISSFLGKQFAISGLYDYSQKTLYKNKGTESNISNLQAAIERLLEIKLGR